MTPFDLYCDTVMSPCPTEQWSDDLIVHASDALRSFSLSDWDKLSISLSDRLAIWRHRVAETLSDGDPTYAIPILMSMLSDYGGEADFAICDSLRAILQSHSQHLVVTRRIADQIEAVANSHNGLAKSSVELLLRQLVVKP